MSRRRKATSTAVWLWLALGGLAIMLCLLPQPVLAQAVSGTILGTVKDSSGAAVAEAKVTLRNTDTGFVRTIVTGSDGNYTGPSLPVGPYAISAEKPGFKAVTLSNVRLDVDQRLRMNLTLEIGAINETIRIEAATPLLQTSSSDVSTTIKEIEIQTLPLNGRDFVQLTRTIPGVNRGVAGTNIDGSAGSYGWRMTASFSANGQRMRDNDFILDGIDNNEAWLNTAVIFPNVDALEEFKVNTSTYEAEFGRSLGGVVNIQVRSGSNSFHGSAYEFMRNDKLDSNDPFNKARGLARPDFSQNQYGGVLGGPIVKDKAFFFVDYQGWRADQNVTMISTVPSEKMRAGDFSELNFPIYDWKNPGTIFPGNKIPSDRIDPAGQNIINLYPHPNTAGSLATNGSGQTINNFILNPTSQRRDNQFDVKLSDSLSANNQAFIRYSFEKSYRLLPSSLGVHGDQAANVSGFGSAGIRNIKAQSVAFNDTHTFSSNWLNEVRVGWSLIDIRAEPIDYNNNLAQQVGITGINIDQLTSSMVDISISDGAIRNMGPTGSQPLIAKSTTWQLTDNVTHVTGIHTLKAGATLLLRSRNVYNSDNGTGTFSFNNTTTSLCAGLTTCAATSSQISKSGFSVAALMLGYASSYSRALLAEAYTERKPDYSAYVQDDIRASNRLTLHLGLRWDVFTPFQEDNDQQSNFDTSTGQFVVASPNAVINGIAVGRRLQTYSKGDFAPRLGFAYDVSGKGNTIIRGGFGMFWNNPLTGTSSSKGQLPPFIDSMTKTSSTYVPTVIVSQGVPPPTPVTGGSTRSSFDPNFRDGHAEQWNLNVQRQIGKDYVFEVGYIGSRGRGLIVGPDVNQAPPVVGVTNPNIDRPFYKINPGLTQVRQNQSKGTLDYHGLQVSFVRRFKNGFSFYNAYTWSKAIDLASDTDGNSDFTNSYNWALNRGPSAYDLTHVFTSNWIYELPFLRGRKLGGWQVNGILLARSGYPFTVGSTATVQSTGASNRPNRIGSGVLSNPTINEWFDINAFVNPSDPTGTYGNSGRDILRGPGQFTVDASLIKKTKLGHVDTELRLEAFNLFNHPAFANPNANIGAANVGTITSLLSLTPMRQVQLGIKMKF